MNEDNLMLGMIIGIIFGMVIMALITWSDGKKYQAITNGKAIEVSDGIFAKYSAVRRFK